MKGIHRPQGLTHACCSHSLSQCKTRLESGMPQPAVEVAALEWKRATATTPLQCPTPWPWVLVAEKPQETSSATQGRPSWFLCSQSATASMTTWYFHPGHVLLVSPVTSAAPPFASPRIQAPMPRGVIWTDCRCRSEQCHNLRLEVHMKASQPGIWLSLHLFQVYMDPLFPCAGQPRKTNASHLQAPHGGPADPACSLRPCLLWGLNTRPPSPPLGHA